MHKDEHVSFNLGINEVEDISCINWLYYPLDQTASGQLHVKWKHLHLPISLQHWKLTFKEIKNLELKS